jgi:hypothetical protein
MLSQIAPVLLDAVDTRVAANGSGPAEPRPELAGCKVRSRGTTPIYLIDPDGYRRMIPFPLTYMNLFKDASLLRVQVCSSLADIIEGEPLDDGTVLVRGRCSEKIYLLDQRKKRLIPNLRIIDKYEFNEEAAVVVPQIVIDALPDGEAWE